VTSWHPAALMGDGEDASGDTDRDFGCLAEGPGP